MSTILLAPFAIMSIVLFGGAALTYIKRQLRTGRW
jgi:hypothetical protein